MTGQELIDALEKTGTGESKLGIARRVVQENANAAASDVLIALASNPRQVGEGTLKKARELMAGSPVSAFLGTPPKSAEEAKTRTLAKEIGLAVAEQLQNQAERSAELGIGKMAQTGRK
jgi:hypothetical protein